MGQEMDANGGPERSATPGRDPGGAPAHARLMLSVAEASEMLGVSDDLVYELAARGELPCIRFGRRRMIPRRAVELLVDEALRNFDPATTLGALVPVVERRQ